MTRQPSRPTNAAEEHSVHTRAVVGSIRPERVNVLMPHSSDNGSSRSSRAPTTPLDNRYRRLLPMPGEQALVLFRLLADWHTDGHRP
jgi:hypothetical protein